MKHLELTEPERYELREGPEFVFRMTRRDFVAGAGLLVLAIGDVLPGQQRGPATLEARLHIGEDGTVTVLTGKIEEGQGALTEFTMVAAEELGLPLDKVRVQMADTDLTPDDGTTAGSRSTPANVPVIRRAAAALRQLREKVAAEQGGRITYAALAKRPELAQTAPGDVKLTAPAEWKILGKPLVRVDAKNLVSGAHQYPSDIVRPGMLYGVVLRPPSFGAKLTGLDPQAARKIGAVAVRDGDFAGCAAASSYQARKALGVLSATAKWEETPQPSSAELFEHLKKTARSPEGGRSRPVVKGDAPAALASATKKLKAVYQAAYIQHAPMEPRAAVAEWKDGALTVWTGTSNPFSVRGQLAQAFQMPQSRIRVIVPHFGGGFGGKHTGEAAIEAARLAKEAGKPVQVRWTRAEEFTWAYARPAALIEVEAALNERGGIAAWDFANYNSGGSAIDSPYRAENVRIRYVPTDSPLRQGSYRALASTANNFARESFIDELAEAARMDPLEFRLQHLENVRIREVLDAAVGKFGWKERSLRKTPNRGVGLACGTEKNSVVAACVEVEVDPKTGTPKLLEICEAFECGGILNPMNLKAQVEGCILMGLGAALREELQFENGRITNARFSQYRVPRFSDVPKIDLVLVDKKDADPVGAGETPIIAVAPAMANAIYSITGKRVRSLPFRMAS